MARLAAPGAPLLVYHTTPSLTAKGPAHAHLREAITKLLRLRACRGEYEPASFVVYPAEASGAAGASAASELRGPWGVVPAAAVDVRAVKCWYQSGEEGGRFPSTRGPPRPDPGAAAQGMTDLSQGRLPPQGRLCEADLSRRAPHSGSGVSSPQTTGGRAGRLRSRRCHP